MRGMLAVLLLGAGLYCSDNGVVALLSAERDFAAIGGTELGAAVLERIEEMERAIEAVMKPQYNYAVEMQWEIDAQAILRSIDLSSQESMLNSAARLVLQMPSDLFYHLDQYRGGQRVMLEKLRGNLVSLRERFVTLRGLDPKKITLSKKESAAIELWVAELGGLLKANKDKPLQITDFSERKIPTQSRDAFVTYWKTNKGELDELFAISLDQNAYSEVTEHDKANKQLIGQFNDLLVAVWEIVEQAKASAKQPAKKS